MIGGLLVAFAGAYVAVVVVPFVVRAREDARWSSCLGRLAQLHVALDNYRHDHGHFPPAFIADENGTPVHSWRVLIQPYMHHEEVFERYDFSEPWNGPHNAALAKSV